MQEQNLNLSQKQLDIIESHRYDQIAELIAEAHNYSRILFLSEYVRNNNHEKWEFVKQELKNMFVVNPQKMYTSGQFLSMDKLLMVRDVFRQEKDLEPVYFQNEVGVILLAVTEGYLQQQLTNEQIVKIRQYFAKNIKKQLNFWGLGQLQSLQNYICDPSTGYFPSFSVPQHEYQLDRFTYFYDFSFNNLSMFPQSTDIWSVLFKMMLCLREERERDRYLLVKIKKMYFQSKYHFQTTLKNMKFVLQFLRNTFSQKECMYYPQRSIVGILERYSQQQLQNLLQGSCLGLKWTASQIYNYFLACIKLGITESTTKMMLAMIKFSERHQKYNELIYNYENNISRLFIFLKYPKLYGITAKLMKFFILSPTPQLTLYQKFVEKALPLASTISKQTFFPFLSLLQVVAFLYKDTTTVSDLSTVIDSLLGEGVNRLTDEQIKAEIDQYNWKVTVKAKALKSVVQTQAGYRGLINIGNSCYLNSFMQSLFMNREFRKEILSISTLQLQKERLKNDQNKGKDPVTFSKTIREDLRPLAELQRLFALLLASKRTEITPLPIRNASPQEFKNNYQHDTLEFGRMFLDLLYKNNVAKIFEGEMVTSIECQACRGIRERKEIFLDLIITPQKEQEQLQQTIEAALSPEIIHDLICDFCNQRRDNSMKRHFLSKIPNYLIVSIKRFQYSVEEKKNQKIMSKLNIRSSIRLKGEDYDIYSLIIHRGPSSNAGHYFCFSKFNFDPNSKWICHNDSDVSELADYKEVTEFLENNESDTPYILFFERRDHLAQMKEELMKPIQMRKPLEDYVQRDFLEEQKSKSKRVLPLYSPFPYNAFFKKDDDEDEGGGQNQPFYNNYIL